MSTAEIEKMSMAERLEAMEALWTSISRNGDAVPSPDWHGEVLAERRAKIEKGEARLVPCREVAAIFQTQATRYA